MTNDNNATTGADIEAMFAVGGGRVGGGPAWIRLIRNARQRAGRFAALAVAVTWVPLLVLAIIDGVAWGHGVKVSLLKDFLPYGQFLVAVPVLILADVTVGDRVGRAVAELRRSDVLAPQDTPVLDTLLASAARKWRGRRVNVVFLLITFAAMIATILATHSGAREWLTGDWQRVAGRVTLPGWWYLLVSVSVLRFLGLRWLWRLMLWAWILWKTSRLNLQPQPAHPDRAGGLAFLGGVQAAFGVLVFVIGVQLSCVVADAVWFRGADLMAYKGQVVAFVLIVVLGMLLPLIVYAPTMLRVRDEHLALLTGSGYRGAAYLNRKLSARQSDELPVDDISALADFGVLYENARLMMLLPLELRHVVLLVVSAMLPFVPLVFLVMPAQEVFKMLAQLVV